MNKDELFIELTNIKKLYTNNKYYMDGFKNVSEFTIKKNNDHFIINYKRYDYDDYAASFQLMSVDDVNEVLDKKDLYNTDGDFIIIKVPSEIDEEFDDFENLDENHLFHLSVPY